MPAPALPPVPAPGAPGAPRPIGVLLLQLGTPDAPTAAAVRRYLREFLSDARVVEAPRALWWAVLHLVVLPFRPRASAAKYRRIWSPGHGSPLLHWTLRQAEEAARELGPGYAVEAAMRYGRPSLADALERLLARGADRLLAFPLYPQYSATTTGSACDALFAAAAGRRVVPALRVVPPFFDDPLYLGAVEARLREALAAEPRPPDHVVLSFHGLPAAMIERGDPYRSQCEATAALLAGRLGLPRERWSCTFQSRFGPARWLEPYTEPRLVELARAGARRAVVATPGFTADCLETLDELGNEAAHRFRAAGGESLRLVPCLNDHPRWTAALAAIVRRETAGWTG